MSKIALVFDFDGTLFDTSEIWRHIGTSYLQHKGIQAAKDVDNRLAFLTLEQGCQYLVTTYLTNDSVEQVIQEVQQHISSMYEQSLPKKGVIPFLQAMKEKQIPMYIVSAGNRKSIINLLSKYQLTEMFKDILTCDQIGMDKTQIELYQYLAKLWHLKISDMYVVEDALHAIETAKEAGCKTIGVYDLEQSEKVKEVADIWIENFESLEAEI